VSAPRPLRIGYLTATLNTGGSERQMLALAGGLPKDRFVVEFILLTEPGVLATAARDAGLKVRLLGWTRRRSRLHFLRWLWDVARLGPDLRRGKYDIVDAWLFHAYAVAALVRPVAGVPVLVSGRRFMSDGQPRSGRVERFLDAVARRRSDAIVAVSDAVRDDVALDEGLDPARIRTIHMGVAIPSPMPESVRNEIRSVWGFGSEHFVVGCVANYKPRKGHGTLIRAVADLRDRLPNLRLVLVGEGTHRPAIEALVAELGLADIVRLHGRELDARRLYGAFDIYAHPSESEGGPNAVVEASASALPIVATRVGGTVEAIEDGVSGLLVPVNDEAAFSAALLRLAGDRALRERLGTAARKRAAEVFGMDRMIAEFSALYEELATRKGIRR
jgi:glycosyltransferase involved in cell wall biosynthesis